MIFFFFHLAVTHLNFKDQTATAMPSRAKKIPYLRFKTLKCHTLWGSTYLSSPYMGLHTLCSAPTRLFVDNYIFIQQNAALSINTLLLRETFLEQQIFHDIC